MWITVGEARTCKNCGWVWVGVLNEREHNWEGRLVCKAKKTDPRYPNLEKPEPVKKISHYENWE
jgi:hypothetical protein